MAAFVAGRLSTLFSLTATYAERRLWTNALEIRRSSLSLPSLGLDGASSGSVCPEVLVGPDRRTTLAQLCWPLSDS